VGSASVQGDVHFAEALQQMGARIEKGLNWIEARVPGERSVEGHSNFELQHISDAAMTLARGGLGLQTVRRPCANHRRAGVSGNGSYRGDGD